MPDPDVLIEIVGEGKTDRGAGGDGPEAPTSGVLPILTHRLCDSPPSMRVRRRPLTFLQGKGLWQKVRFAKRQASVNRAAGLVFVLDTEGSHPDILTEMQKGRDSENTAYPMAVGVAHPCVEAWLLADPAAIARALTLPRPPTVPDDPEALPAPCRDREQSPKAMLGRCSGRQGHLAAAETTKIAREMKNLDRVRSRCPLSFQPFAAEVVTRIKPRFNPAESP